MRYSAIASERARQVLWDDAVSHFERVARTLETIWSFRPPKRDGYALISQPEIVAAIQSLAVNFGLVASLMFDDGPKRSTENTAMHQMRVDRVQYFKDLLIGIDTSIYRDKSLRNRHLHADEYLCKMLAKSPASAIFQNIALSEKAAINATVPIIYVRVYAYGEDVLMHLGSEFDARQLYEANLLIAERLRSPS